MDVLSISEVQSELTVDVLLYRRWLEPRLHPLQPLQAGRLYALEPHDSQRLWKPDLYVMGVRHFTTRDDEMAVRHLRLLQGGFLDQVIRATIVMKCNFDFRLYPFDVQECKMDFMSPVQTLEEQRMSWYPGLPPVDFYREPEATSPPPLSLSLAQYEAFLTFCPHAFAAQHVSGNVSALRLWLVLHRDVTAPLLELYLPAAVFVAASWTSFLVRPDMVPGRMVLLVTTLLSLVTLFESSRSSAPPSQGVRSLDVWQLSCLLFVSLALLEYAALLCGLRGRFCRPCRRSAPAVRVAPASATGALAAVAWKAKRAGGGMQKTPRVQSAARKLRSLLRLQEEEPWGGEVKSGGSDGAESEAGGGWVALDRASLLVFPTGFAAFSAAYWCAHLSLDPRRDFACEPPA